MKAIPDTPDGRLAARAAASRGIVDFDDIDAAGLSRRAVSRRVVGGRLHRVHPGVFALGHAALDLRAQAVAALKAGGRESLLTHQSSTALWGLTPWPASPHITVAAHRRITGVVTHQARKMPRPTLREGLRTTLVCQALLDFAEAGSEDEVVRAMNEALFLRRTSTAAVDRFLRSCPGRRGVAVLTRLLPDAGALHSPLEDEFFALLKAAKLPVPEPNVKVLGHRVDYWWPDARLVGETDGWAAHGNRLRFEADRERDADLLAAHIPTTRITRHALRTRPLAVAARLGAALLGRRRFRRDYLMISFMLMKVLRISKGGQVSVPAAVRKRWATSRLTLEDRGDELVLRPAPDDPIAALRGSLKGRLSVSSQELRTRARADEQAAAGRRAGAA